MKPMKKTVGLVSLGCSKNRVDSENLLGMLCDRGWEIVSDPAEAGLIVVNTCGFIESAKEESIEAIFEMAQYKNADPDKKLLVTGCLSQRYAQDLMDEITEIDGLMGVADYARLDDCLDQIEKGKRPLFVGMNERFIPCSRVLTTPKYSAYVKISDGCDNRCTYCAIPLIRGGYVSRPYDDILAECERLSKGGVHELSLIAQDTSRYGNDFPEKTLLLPKLLGDVSSIEGVHWTRVLYCYPDTVNETLLDTIANTKGVAPYMDLPLQHINGDLLHRMNRRGTPEHIRDMLKKCRERNILLRTTFIVGFPGETEAQFEELCNFVKEVRFDRMGAFAYSPEEGTKGAEMPDQIDEDVKQERLDKLMLLQQGISQENNEKRVGSVCEVLCEGTEDGHYIGRSILEAPEVDGAIVFDSKKEIAEGEYVQVKITSADAYDLYGEAMDA